MVTQTRFQIISIYLLSLGLVLAVLFWRIDRSQMDEALRSSELHSRSQLNLLNHSSSKDLKNWAERLVTAYRESARDQQSDRPHPFLAWSKAEIGEGQEWVLENTFTLPLEQDGLGALMTLLAKSVSKPKDIGVGRTELLAFLDMHRRPQFVMAYRPHVQSLYMGLLPPDMFQAMMDQQKGQFSIASLVNDKGQVLGHTISEYVGTSFKSDMLVDEIVTSQQASGSGNFKNFKSEQILGFYERIANTNVYAILTTPMNQILKDRQALRLQFLFLAMGLALFGTGVIVFLTGIKKPEAEVTVLPVTPTGVPPLKYFLKTDDVVRENPEPQRLMDNFVKELKAPLASILAQTKMVKEKITSDAQKRELEWVEKQAREAHQMIQDLDTKSSGKSFSTRGSLTSVLEKVLKNYQTQFEIKGVQVKKELSALPTFVFDFDKIEKAFSNVIKNAIEAMERSPYKELHVRAFMQNTSIRIEVKDSGLGMSPDEALRALNPFYTTKDREGHVGLGLSTALRNVKEYLGDIQISSKEGRGTTVSFVFPTTETLRAKSVEPNDRPVINSFAMKETMDIIDSFEEEKIEPMVIAPLKLEKINVEPSPQPVVLENFSRPSKLDKFQVQIRKPGERV